jgi:hypothetical protein
MKKGKMKYRLTVNGVHQNLNVETLYKDRVKGQWQKIKGRPYQSKSITVELNLAQSSKEADHWLMVKLLFVRGVNEDKEQANTTGPCS